MLYAGVMGKTKRDAPIKAKSSDSRYSLMDFIEEFPDDSACLEFLVRKLYPEGVYCEACERVTPHTRVKGRTAYACGCGRHEHPLVGTIFEGSSTSLKLWFYAIYLMASTRCGISAKQLEREIGVSYPTALRMFRQVRSMLGQDDDPLSGTVEVDEAYIGGKAKWRNRGIADRANAPKKTMVLGMVERREGRPGKVVARATDPKAEGFPIAKQVSNRVLPASTVYTDNFIAYWSLGKVGYRHERVNHQAHVYVDGDVHTNTIEGFWSLVKTGLSGVFHGVSTEHLQGYLDEYVFRYNNREITGRRGMFDAFLSRIEKSPSAS